MGLILKNANILVTGGTGFVGSHLVEALLEEDANVITTFLDLDPSSYFATKKLNEKTVMVQADVEDFEKLYDIVTKYDIEFIFHLAAQALVEPAYYNPKRTLKSNILGTINVLESAKQYPKIRAVIVASSDKAYGKLKKRKYLESDALNGDHPYEVSKSAADLIAQSYFKTYDLPVVITRFGNIYGEGDLNFSRIIPGTLKAIIESDTLQIRSNGKFVRDYIYVKDVINGYLILAKNIDKAKGEAFNFGSKESLSVLKVVKLIEKLTDSKVRYKILDIEKNEIPYQSLDYKKINKMFSWEPQSSVASTMNNIEKWYKTYYLQKSIL